jgi:MFS family permease
MRPGSRNVRLFIAFRTLFNARFYYPVYGLLFVDLGLTAAEMAALNAVWAAAIVGLEVPSGALADRIGRKPLVVAAAGLMVIEMALFLAAPSGHHGFLVAVLFVNRLASGMAEAAASGADEALVYDSLVAEGRQGEWPKVLERLMRWQSATFVVVMLVGGVAYDPAAVNVLAEIVGLPGTWAQSDTVRLPVWLTLACALAAVPVTLLMKESVVRGPSEGPGRAPTTWAIIVETGAWMARHRAVLGIIIAGIGLDCFVRLFLLVSSNYYRVIGVPEWAYGPIGASFAVFGFLSATLGRRMVERLGRRFNFLVTGGLVLVGLGLAAAAWPGWGLLVLVPLGISMNLQGFFVSHYLNAEAPPERRATVLSFKGFALNIGFGAAAIGYAILCAVIANGIGPTPHPDEVIKASLIWLPVCFVAVSITLAAAYRLLRVK